jgi:hypothetical protein
MELAVGFENHTKHPLKVSMNIGTWAVEEELVNVGEKSGVWKLLLFYFAMICTFN